MRARLAAGVPFSDERDDHTARCVAGTSTSSTRLGHPHRRASTVGMCAEDLGRAPADLFSRHLRRRQALAAMRNPSSARAARAHAAACHQAGATDRRDQPPDRFVAPGEFVTLVFELTSPEEVDATAPAPSSGRCGTRAGHNRTGSARGWWSASAPRSTQRRTAAPDASSGAPAACRRRCTGGSRAAPLRSVAAAAPRPPAPRPAPCAP